MDVAVAPKVSRLEEQGSWPVTPTAEEETAPLSPHTTPPEPESAEAMAAVTSGETVVAERATAAAPVDESVESDVLSDDTAPGINQLKGFGNW